MAGIEVPGLGRKLRLLIDYGHFKNLEEIARVFDREASTLQWWGHGSDDRKPGTIPGNKLETVIDVVFSCLPEGFSKKETKRLVFAPVAELEAVLQTQAMVSLNRIIEAEAKINAGSFFNKPENNIGLIETNQKTPRPHPEHSTSLNKWFRLEFTAGSETGYFSAFQHVGQAWGAVSIHFDKNRKTILLPGVTDDGAIAFMRERQETGLHRFIVMHTPEPPPPEYLRYFADRIALDGFIVGRMAQFFDGQSIHRRQLFLMEVEIK